VSGATAAIVVGASFPVSQALVDYPFATSQLVRYLLGAALLTALLKGRLGRPTRSELVRLTLVAAVGMALFNLVLLAAVDEIGATNTGVVVGISPVLLAVAVPLLARRRPSPQLLACAAAVVAGAAIVNGTDDRLTVLGALLATGALLGEVGFTLLAAPLLPRLGPMRVAAWAAWIASAQLGLLSVLSRDLQAPDGGEIAAIAYLAVMTTALAFVLWFSAVARLGADRAGLLVGLMPVAALTVDVALNGHAPTAADVAGTAIVAAGVALGARAPVSAQASASASSAGAGGSGGASPIAPASEAALAAVTPAGSAAASSAAKR
jgi:drug/metabolite transporter (DMT)-like permease